jgi:dolichol-phosphate mannosyltransferase
MTNHLLSVIIPAYNEQDSIELIIEKVSNVSLGDGWAREIIIVNDKSTDKTAEILSKYEKIHTVINRPTNGGKGSALRDGLRVAKGDYVLIQDADSEYDPEDYKKLLAPINEGQSNVVFGSRALGASNVSYSRVYYYGGLMLTKVFNFCFHTHLTDLATCYKVFPKKYVGEIIAQPSNDFTFDVVELSYVLASNERIIEVPISYNARSLKEGKKLNITHGVKCFLKIMKLYFKK